MLLQSCHFGVLRVFSIPLGLWNKLKSFIYFSEKCKSDIYYNRYSHGRLYRLCTYWFVRIEMCVLIIFMVFYSQHTCAPPWTELGFFVVYQFLAQDKAVVSAVCWVSAFWVSSTLDGFWVLWGKIFLCRWFLGPSPTVTVYCCVPVKARLSWHLGSIYMCKWEKKGKSVTANKWWVLDRETCVFGIAENQELPCPW